jgi:hypothetical protein
MVLGNVNLDEVQRLQHICVVQGALPVSQKSLASGENTTIRYCTICGAQPNADSSRARSVG